MEILKTLAIYFYQKNQRTLEIKEYVVRKWLEALRKGAQFRLLENLRHCELKSSSRIALGKLPCIQTLMEVRGLTILESNRGVETPGDWCTKACSEGESDACLIYGVSAKSTLQSKDEGGEIIMSNNENECIGERFYRANLVGESGARSSYEKSSLRVAVEKSPLNATSDKVGSRFAHLKFCSITLRIDFLDFITEKFLSKNCWGSREDLTADAKINLNFKSYDKKINQLKFSSISMTDLKL